VLSLNKNNKEGENLKKRKKKETERRRRSKRDKLVSRESRPRKKEKETKSEAGGKKGVQKGNVRGKMESTRDVGVQVLPHKFGWGERKKKGPGKNLGRREWGIGLGEV